MSTNRRALEALLDITERSAYANLRLKQAQRGLTSIQAKWVSALVYETLDHLLFIDYLLLHYARNLKNPVIRGILRIGVCQLLFMRKRPETAVDSCVRLAKETGKEALSGYVNAVLRSIERNKEYIPKLPEDIAEHLSIKYSWPLWIVGEWLARFGAERTEELLKTPKQQITLRPQPPYTVEELKNELLNRKIPFISGIWETGCLKISSGLDFENEPLFKKGLITIQSESAMLACRVCGVQPGMKVLDACAAPGGKSAYLFALCNEIALTSWELHPHRKLLLDKTLERLNVKASTLLLDAAVPVEAYNSAFDAVLLDMPCSGLGVAASKPDIRYSKSPEAIDALVKIQSSILNTCANYVRPGGALVYITCTISLRENENQIEAFLKRRADYSLDSLEKFLPIELLGENHGMVQLMPTNSGMEGFFIARLLRGVAL
ncbi:MAG: Ribosomal RNA small subunit methyltransferase B [Firmicutes bacterium ADurb.Bin356]|nr:MAG: Ribosomal RNA small subunit methyltransferase B [Firmicutes bacterium ADurb.Bin356]